MLACLSAAAQQRRPAIPKLEDLPAQPVDTLDTGRANVKVVIYTNNTWKYLYTDQEEKMDNGIFDANWVTNHIFAYKEIGLKDLPEVMELDLIDDMDDFHPPVTGRVSSRYGPRGRASHNGTDVPLKVGEPIYAAFDGKVRYSRFNTGGYGNLVIIRHSNGLETWYAHLVRNNVQVGDYVKAGAVIGFGGNTGRSRGAHLHFEVRYCDQSFDPEHIIDFNTGDIRYKTFALHKSYVNINSRASDQLLVDDDFEEAVLMAANNSEGVTSDEILKNIAAYSGEGIKAGASDPLYHTIKRGDSLYKIATQYGTTVKSLCSLNGITEKSVIMAGKKLRVR